MESLEILNGELSPKYDKYNDIYTVNISSEVKRLDLKYKINENKTVNVYGNVDLEEGKNKVLIAISGNDEIEYITLIVNKEKTTLVLNAIDNTSGLTISNDSSIPSYAQFLIGISCFMVIILLYLVMFRKNKVYRNK